MRVRSGHGASAPCGCVLAVLAFNLTVGGLCVNYVLASVLGRTVPFVCAALVGLPLGEVALPAALACWLLRLCGVHAPFVGVRS